MFVCCAFRGAPTRRRTHRATNGSSFLRAAQGSEFWSGDDLLLPLRAAQGEVGRGLLLRLSHIGTRRTPPQPSPSPMAKGREFWSVEERLLPLRAAQVEVGRGLLLQPNDIGARRTPPQPSPSPMAKGREFWSSAKGRPFSPVLKESEMIAVDRISTLSGRAPVIDDLETCAARISSRSTDRVRRADAATRSTIPSAGGCRADGTPTTRCCAATDSVRPRARWARPARSARAARSRRRS